MNPKPAWLSKTVILNLVALLCAFFPPVAAWISSNPEGAAGVIAAANIILRFATNGAISITGAGESSGGPSGGAAPLVLLVGTAALFMGSAPSCSSSNMEAFRSIPIKTTYYAGNTRVSYSSKNGLEVEVDGTSGK